MDIFEIAQMLLEEDPTETLERASDERLFLIDALRAAQASIMRISEEECRAAFVTNSFPTFDLAFLHFYSQELYHRILKQTLLFKNRSGASLRECIARTCSAACQSLRQQGEGLQ